MQYWYFLSHFVVFYLIDDDNNIYESLYLMTKDYLY